jgi:hypothetical protein
MSALGTLRQFVAVQRCVSCQRRTRRSAAALDTAAPDPEPTLRASADCKMPSTPLTYPYQFGILEPVLARWGADVIRSIESGRVHHSCRWGGSDIFPIWPPGAHAPAAAGDRLAQRYFAAGSEQSWAAPPGARAKPDIWRARIS